MGRISKREKPLFARNASARAKTLGLNGQEIAEKAGLPYPTVRDIMAGVSRGLEENKEAIAKALGSTMGELYDPGMHHATAKTVGEMSPKDLIQFFRDNQLTAEESELLRLFREGDDVRRKTILQFARMPLRPSGFAKRRRRPSG